MSQNQPPEAPLSKEEAIKMLQEGRVSEWNEIRQKFPKWRPDLEKANLHRANLKEANLEKTNLHRANLTEANLIKADLREASLIGAELTNATLVEAKLLHAALWTANLRGADLVAGDLRKADFTDTDLRGALIWKANLREADLQFSNLEGAKLAGANLKDANLREANLSDADVSQVKFNRLAKYRGIRVATCYGSPRFKRFAEDQDYIEEFRSVWWRYPIYLLWLILADCGRSLWPWIGWSAALAVGFGIVYHDVLPPGSFHASYRPWERFTAIYYSVVTFTTLGFGDVVPMTARAARWVMAEVITGYVMLGGLISILATKLARRS